ncbi:hypothetical protein EHE19_005785 [Ruminiclostridium herbifermentans]|uniref:Uncharacterized protein n=1 Tax=Ruminiclostridium herbifermentans TaxID=2488810 RepID=A0A7H1VRE1_9FIRM|nr:hypothetical protein [Ruminiclostridium herbifermentans]QNU67953.1 hypothetical protein EHE19_005785 [Ruminiclostridium herbifermentans]
MKLNVFILLSFSENADSDSTVHYDEYVFDIPQTEIGKYSLYGTFVTSGLFTEGN